MKVPFLDLKAAYNELAPKAEPAILQSLRSGWYILGSEVENFESSFSDYCGADHAIGLANGLDALRLALVAIGIEPGDKVLVPSHTFIATWLAVSQCGAIPVPVEPDPKTYNITAATVRSAMQPGVKALVVVHLYGQPANILELMSVSEELGIDVIEDAAQAHGARWRGQQIGSHSKAVCWSFYPGKNLGALGDGGAVTTKDPNIADQLRLLRNYGSRKKYENEIIGFNSRLDPVQAAFLSVKLGVLEDWNERRRQIAEKYLNAFKELAITLPEVAIDATPVWHLFVVLHPQRDKLAEKLAQQGVQTLVHYPVAPHLQPPYAALNFKREDLPIARKLADEVLSLPIGPHMKDWQVNLVIDAVGSSV